MPELPEVEHAARRLRAAAVGRTLLSVRTLHAATRRALPDEVARTLGGRRVEAVDRRGKHQWIALDDGSTLHAHFRMTGDWDVAPTSQPLAPHARAALDLSDGTTVALVDPRALGSLVWQPSGTALPTLAPDATSAEFDGAHLAAALKGRRQSIKAALLDQRVVAGVGNIYAAEALWRAGVDPETPAGSLSRIRIGRLVAAIRDVLADALGDPGRYADGDARQRLAVYGREGEGCARCGRPIARMVQAGRSTYYCARCQR